MLGTSCLQTLRPSTLILGGPQDTKPALQLCWMEKRRMREGKPFLEICFYDFLDFIIQFPCARQWASYLRCTMSLITTPGGRLITTAVYEGGYHGPLKRQNDLSHTRSRERIQTKEVYSLGYVLLITYTSRKLSIDL